MPGGFPLGMEFCNGTDVGSNTTSVVGTSVAPSASANTMGLYTQLIGATAADAVAATVTFQVPNTATQSYAFNIAVGGAGSEKVIAGPLLVGNANSSWIMYYFPAQIPAGTRVAVQCQCSAASAGSPTVVMELFDGSLTHLEGTAGVDAIGFSSATTLGTPVTNGLGPTPGSFAQLIAATKRDYMGFLVYVDVQNVAVATGSPMLFDIAIGAGGSEKVIVPNLGVTVRTGASNVYTNPSGPFFVPIPAGTRVAARGMDTVPNSTGVSIYGIYQ